MNRSKKILVLTKRYYTGKDLVGDRFGRLYGIPNALLEHNCEVLIVTLNYRGSEDESRFPLGDDCYSFRIYSIGIGRYFHRVFYYYRSLRKIVEEYQPDVIWACSDSFHAIMGRMIGKLYSVPTIIDLYDNFESFGATKIPLVKSLLVNACQKADGVTCASVPLKDYVVSRYRLDFPVLVLENGIGDDFVAVDKIAARQSLGLGEKDVLIGTSGALTHSRGIRDLFSAYEIIREKREEIKLVVAGPRDKGIVPTGERGVVDLGIVSYVNSIALLSALDVAIICNKNSAFGRYCYPQKFNEILACKTPVMSADVGALASVLEHQQEFLYPPGDSRELARRIESLLDVPRTPDVIPRALKEQARIFARYMDDVMK